MTKKRTLKNLYKMNNKKIIKYNGLEQEVILGEPWWSEWAGIGRRLGKKKYTELKWIEPEGRSLRKSSLVFRR